MRILFLGGGTGGHFFPIIAVARELKKIADENRIVDIELIYVGPDDFGKGILAEEDIGLQVLPTGKLRRYLSIQNIVDAFLTISAILKAFWRLFVIMPDVIFSKGGYGAFPMLFVARIYRIPVIIHDSDAIPGRVSRWSGKFAKRVGVAFASAAAYFKKEKTEVVGNPIRKRVLGGNKEIAKENFSILSEKPVLFFIGGSQGAQPINQIILAGLPDFVNDFELIHITGERNFQDVTDEASVILNADTKGGYHVYSFMKEADLRQAYAVADLIVARASASVIFEIAAVGKPSLLIPLPHSASDHQRANAYEYAKISGAMIIEESNATPYLVRHTILRLFENSEELAKMARGAQRFARIDSAEVIAREILAVAQSH